MRGSERLWRRLRRDYNDTLDTCDLRGDRRHEQSGRQRMTPAGNIATDDPSGRASWPVVRPSIEDFFHEAGNCR